MKNSEETTTISVLVENRPGVLNGITSLLLRRGFNIESISAGTAELEDLVRITIAMKGDERIIDQVVKQLGKLVYILSVSELEPQKTVTRELALVKVNTSDPAARSDVINYTEIFKAHVIDVAHETLIVEITGDSEKIDAFIGLMKPFGVRQIARTGVTALPRGAPSTQSQN